MDPMNFNEHHERPSVTARTTGAAMTAVLAVAFSLGGCGKKPADTPGASANPAQPSEAGAPSAQAPASILGEMPVQPTPVETAVPGAPLPQVTTEMMLQFEARFGRPPSNYTELRRLSEPARKPVGR